MLAYMTTNISHFCELGIYPYCSCDSILFFTSVVDCGELSDPENGQVMYPSTVYLSQAVYSCDTGYELSGTGSTLRICRANGQWTSFPPECNRKYTELALRELLN